jgi:hypothetical protein
MRTIRNELYGTNYTERTIRNELYGKNYTERTIRKEVLHQHKTTLNHNLFQYTNRIINYFQRVF